MAYGDIQQNESFMITKTDAGGNYQIRFCGTVDPHSCGLLNGFEVTPGESGTCAPVRVLTGWVPDKAVLMGILYWLFENKCTLLSLMGLDAKNGRTVAADD